MIFVYYPPRMIHPSYRGRYFATNLFFGPGRGGVGLFWGLN